MFKNQIRWLERHHLNHLAIALGLFYPMVLLHQLAGGNCWTAAITWSLMYYMREVTQYGRLGLFRSLFPWLWGFHDRTQTIYVIVGSFFVAFLGSL